MTNRRPGPTCAARESEVDLDDFAQSRTEPIDTGEHPGRNLGGRPRGADVADLDDANERQNVRRKRNRALKAEDEAAQAIFRANMEKRDRREREELRTQEDMARQQRLRGKNGSAPNSCKHPRTGEKAPLFPAAHLPQAKSSRKKKKKQESTFEPDDDHGESPGGSQHGHDAPSSDDDAEGRTAGQPGLGDTHPLPVDKATGGRARRRGCHAPKAAGGGARALALGDHYDEGAFAEVCAKYVVETEECGVLAAAKRQPENPSHRLPRPVGTEFLTAAEYVFLYLSAQTAAARCTLCDEFVVADAERHVELAPYLTVCKRCQENGSELPRRGAQAGNSIQAPPAADVEHVDGCSLSGGSIEAMPMLSRGTALIDGGGGKLVMCDVVPCRRKCAQCGAEVRTSSMDCSSLGLWPVDVHYVASSLSLLNWTKVPFFIDIAKISEAFYLRFFANTSITGMLKAWELTAIAAGSDVNLTSSRMVQGLNAAVVTYGVAWTETRQYLQFGQAVCHTCNSRGIKEYIFDCSSCNGRKGGPKPNDTIAMLTHHANKMKMENDVTAMLCTESPILISKADVQAYVAADFDVRVDLKLLSATKATAMTTRNCGCGKVNFKSTAQDEANPAAQPLLYVEGARETTLGLCMCAHGYIVKAVSTHMPENSGLIRTMLHEVLSNTPLRVHTTTGPDGKKKKDGVALYDVCCVLGVNTKEIFAAHHGTPQANKTRPDVTATPEQVSAFRKEQADAERAQLSKLTVESLRGLCSEYGESAKGLKASLVATVQAARSESVRASVNVAAGSLVDEALLALWCEAAMAAAEERAAKDMEQEARHAWEQATPEQRSHLEAAFAAEEETQRNARQAAKIAEEEQAAAAKKSADEVATAKKAQDAAAAVLAERLNIEWLGFGVCAMHGSTHGSNCQLTNHQYAREGSGAPMGERVEVAFGEMRYDHNKNARLGKLYRAALELTLAATNFKADKGQSSLIDAKLKRGGNKIAENVTKLHGYRHLFGEAFDGRSKDAAWRDYLAGLFTDLVNEAGDGGADGALKEQLGWTAAHTIEECDKQIAAMTAHIESITQVAGSSFSKKGAMPPELLVALDLSGDSLKPTSTFLGAQAILANLRSARDRAIAELQKECTAEDDVEPYDEEAYTGKLDSARLQLATMMWHRALRHVKSNVVSFQLAREQFQPDRSLLGVLPTKASNAANLALLANRRKHLENSIACCEKWHAEAQTGPATESLSATEGLSATHQIVFDELVAAPTFEGQGRLTVDSAPRTIKLTIHFLDRRVRREIEQQTILLDEASHLHADLLERIRLLTVELDAPTKMQTKTKSNDIRVQHGWAAVVLLERDRLLGRLKDWKEVFTGYPKEKLRISDVNLLRQIAFLAGDFRLQPAVRRSHSLSDILSDVENSASV